MTACNKYHIRALPKVKEIIEVLIREREYIRL